MAELILTPSPGDPSLYTLAQVGTLRWERTKRPFVAAAQAGAQNWGIEQDGMWRQHATVTDGEGLQVAVYRTRGWTRSGGTIDWQGRRLKLRPTAMLHIAFALVDGEREIAALRSRRAGDVVVVPPQDLSVVDLGPLLLAVFAVRAQILCTVPAGL